MMMMETNNLNLLPEDTLTASTAVLFPVIFFDGEREIDVGPVPITPSLTFKSFQSILSTKLQISPHQITIYFQRPNNNNNTFLHHNPHRRRHAVTSKFDFAAAISDSDSDSAFFYVVQKRSRRTRRRKPKNVADSINGNNNNNFVLLRRGNSTNNYHAINSNNNINNNGNLNELEYFEYVKRMAMIQRERERYLMSMSLNSNVYDDLSCYYDSYNGGCGLVDGGINSNFSDDAASSASSASFCDVCFNAASRGGNDTVPFHWCKNDVVTKVFRSPAGPIAPPLKNNNGFFG